MKTTTNQDDSYPTIEIFISFTASVIGYAVLLANLVLLYHLGDADGNLRVTFGWVSTEINRFITGMNPQQVRGTLLVGSAVLAGLITTATLTGLSSAKRIRNTTTTSASLLSASLAVAYLIGWLVVMSL